MKRFLISTFILCLTSSICFAIPNIKLYMETKPFLIIQDNKLYDSDNELLGVIKDENIVLIDNEEGLINKIQEDEKYICIYIYDFSEPTIVLTNFKFLKENGNLVMHQIGKPNKHADTYLFYENSGLLKKETCYSDTTGEFLYSTELIYDDEKRKIKEIEYKENEIIDYYTEYIYDSQIGKISQEKIFDSNNKLKDLLIYTYDKKTRQLLYENYYDENNELYKKIEYDLSQPEKILYEYDYNTEQGLTVKTIYNTKTGKKIERLVYSKFSKEPDKWRYLDFEDTYELESDYYLSRTFCSYYSLSSYTKEDLENWNELYSATIRKVNIYEYFDEYIILRKLEEGKNLFNNSFTLCNRNKHTYYCFPITDSDKIDYENCYEIKLTKKQIDYTTLNKSGKGKGPFGFDIGMTYDEVKEACNGETPEHISDDRYYVKPKNTHPLFEKYIVWISPKYGVYYVKGISKNVNTSEYGTEVKAKFENLLSILEKKYGKFTKIDSIKSDYNLKDEQYWMRALVDGARTYKAYWSAYSNNINKWDGLSQIIIGINPVNSYSTSSAYFWVEYEFRNYEDSNDLLNDVL